MGAQPHSPGRSTITDASRAVLHTVLGTPSSRAPSIQWRSPVTLASGCVPLERVGEGLRIALRAPYQLGVIGPAGFVGDHMLLPSLRIDSPAFGRTADASSRYEL
jgi:hypothetical protein